jgi:flagellar basal body-associated protein FliL
MQPSDKTVSGRWVAIVIAIVIFVAVVAGCYWMYINYLVAPRQP